MAGSQKTGASRCARATVAYGSVRKSGSIRLKPASCGRAMSPLTSMVTILTEDSQSKSGLSTLCGVAQSDEHQQDPAGRCRSRQRIGNRAIPIHGLVIDQEPPCDAGQKSQADQNVEIGHPFGKHRLLAVVAENDAGDREELDDGSRCRHFEHEPCKIVDSLRDLGGTAGPKSGDGPDDSR